MGNKFVRSISRAMNSTPGNQKELTRHFVDDLQNKIDDVSDWASTTTEIEEEVAFGTLQFRPLKCRVNHAIDPKTGLNLGDDFKVIKFFELDRPRTMGQRYRFDNSIWLTTNTNNLKHVTKNAVIRRCNNELRWIDIPTKSLISEPVVVEYALKYANIYYNHVVDIPQGTQILFFQFNERSRKITLNDRFVIGSHVFKVKTLTDGLRAKTYEQDSVPMVMAQVYIDTIFADDNFAVGSSQYNPDYPENLANLNKYIDIWDKHTTDVETIQILPDIRTIYIGETVDFSCYEWLNGKRTKAQFNFTFENLNTDYFGFKIIDGNHFSIKNLKVSLDTQLKVICTNRKSCCKQEILINLGGAF